jgi:mRNA-degrading endonuclease RelE of RelBE toxin-antitoxin system
MAHAILFQELAATELQALRAYDQRRIVDAIEEHLRQQPTISTRRRKCLADLTPSFEHVPPVWELRVGDFRVFYDVDADAGNVHIRAVRPKGPAQTTGDIT